MQNQSKTRLYKMSLSCRTFIASKYTILARTRLKHCNHYGHGVSHASPQRRDALPPRLPTITQHSSRTMETTIS